MLVTPRITRAFAAVTIAGLLASLAAWTVPTAAVAGDTNLSAWGTAEIDGQRSPGEWEGAARLDFMAAMPAVDGGGAVPASIYVMNDARNLYLASSLAAIPGCTYNPIFEFDNDNDGNPGELGSDWLAVHVPRWASGDLELLDMFVWPLHNVGFDTYTADGYPPAGTIDGTAAGSHPDAQSTWVEISHPLDSADDAHDISVRLGDTVGLLFDAHTYGAGCGNCSGPDCHGSTLVPDLGLARILIHPDLEKPFLWDRPLVGGRVPSTLGQGSTWVGWGGSDRHGTGIARYDVQRQVDGGAWTAVASTSARGIAQALSYGHAYRYRVRPRDRAGNIGSWVSSAQVRPTLVEGSSAMVSYTAGTWRTQMTGNASGGSTRWSSSTGATARLTFTGKAFAWVASRGSTRGRVHIYIDGRYYRTVDLGGQTAWRQIVYTAAWSYSDTRTIVLKSVTPGLRFDIDAFVVYR